MSSDNVKTSYGRETPDPLIGTTVAGRYEVVKRLGEGGMGSVYLATHSVLEKQVALKVLHGEFARKPDLVERFMQEAKAASRIRHENVIDISDFGVTPEGLVFFAMELLNGHDLHDDFARAKRDGELLPWTRTKKIYLQICAALSAAHARGIVHRDLKPENIYLVEFLGDPDFVKLLDFGIAKQTDVSNEEGGRKLTKTGMLFGTPEYMSPEQARGEKVDHRVDIYAMGCILFQLVSGRVPFEADNFMGVLSLHLTQEPPKIAPETFDMTGAPRGLADIIERALVKDRNQRWQTIDELAAAIRDVSGDAAPVAQVPVRAATAPARESARSKSEWTGNVSLPRDTDPFRPAERSKLPLVLVSGLVFAGGVAAAVFVLRDRLSPAPEAAPPELVAAQPVAPAPTPPPAPVPSPSPAPEPVPAPRPPPALPDMVEIAFTSAPKGAKVFDVSTGRQLGKTPYTFTVPGSLEPRQFKFVMRGYGDATVEIVPNQAKIDYAQTLHKGKTRPGVTKLEPKQEPPPPVEAKVETKPEPTPDAPKPEPTAATVPEAKPDPKPSDDCPGDEPCLKVNIPGMGGK